MRVSEEGVTCLTGQKIKNEEGRAVGKNGPTIRIIFIFLPACLQLLVCIYGCESDIRPALRESKPL